MHDSLGNGPETFQWDIDAQGWDFSGHQRRCAGAKPLSAEWTRLSCFREAIHPALRHGAGSSWIYMRGGDSFGLKHRQTLRDCEQTRKRALSPCQRGSAETRRLYALIPIERGSRLANITARDLGSLASPYSFNNGTYALRTGSYSDGLARRWHAAAQWSKDVRRMVAL